MDEYNLKVAGDAVAEIKRTVEHNDSHSHGHEHEYGNLKTAFFINTLFALIEFVGGMLLTALLYYPTLFTIWAIAFH